MKRAPNMQVILDYTQRIRPDCLDTMAELLDDTRKLQVADLILFVAAISFAAGRDYQKQHPELSNPLDFHTDRLLSKDAKLDEDHAQRCEALRAAYIALYDANGESDELDTLGDAIDTYLDGQGFSELAEQRGRNHG